MKTIEAQEGYQLYNSNTQEFVTSIYLPDTADTESIKSQYQEIENSIADIIKYDNKIGNQLVADYKKMKEEAKKQVVVLDSIKSTGTQYIVTDFVPNKNTKIVIDAIIPQYTVNGTNKFILSTENNGKNRFSLLDGRSSDGISGIRFDIGNKISSYIGDNIKFGERNILELSKNGFKINGEIVGTPSEGWDTEPLFTDTLPLQIFSSPFNTQHTSNLICDTSIYEISIYQIEDDEEELIMHLEPSSSFDDNDNRIYGLKDTINDKFYGNAAEGVDFVPNITQVIG